MIVSLLHVFQFTDDGIMIGDISDILIYLIDRLELQSFKACTKDMIYYIRIGSTKACI